MSDFRRRRHRLSSSPPRSCSVGGDRYTAGSESEGIHYRISRSARHLLRTPGAGQPQSRGTASAASRARMGELPETVRFKNRFALAITTTTPLEAMVEDLLFIRDISTPQVSSIYSSAKRRAPRDRGELDRAAKTCGKALVEGCANAPFYSKTVDAKKSPALLVATVPCRKPTSHGSSLVPSEGSRRKRYELRRDIGVQIELWSISDEEIVLPVENSLTRRTVLPEEAVRGTVERFGRIWPTIENMFADHASDISFDIDLVFSWVDGSSKEFQAQRAKRMQNYIVGEGTNQRRVSSDRRAQVRATVHPHVRAVDPTDLRRNRFRSSGLACGRSASHVHAQRKVLRRSKCVAHP